MTFSIVARDAETGELGGAVASKFLAVGSVVLWAEAGVGAVATQSYANPRYGPDGLRLLGEGAAPADVLDRLTGEDEDREQRQAGAVDARGRAASFTGEECLEWAGGRTGDGYAVQGNILAGEAVVQDMADAFEATDGDLAARLVAALAAGDAAGGDRRGRQSAALLVVEEGGGYGGLSDRKIDLRVDDHRQPVAELERLLDLWRLYFTRPDPDAAVSVEGAVRREVEAALRQLGHLGRGEELTEASLQEFLRTENFEERELPGMTIDPGVLRWLRERTRQVRARP